jgi:hypothetical protein
MNHASKRAAEARRTASSASYRSELIEAAIRAGKTDESIHRAYGGDMNTIKAMRRELKP